MRYAERLQKRYAKFRAHGQFLEKGVPAKTPRKKAAPKAAPAA